MVGSEETTRARLSGEIRHLCASVLALQALVTEADVRLFSCGRVANSHAETLEKSAAVASH